MTKKTILKISDEVNCKFYDLDPKIRRELSLKFEFFVPGAQYMPKFKLGRWNGKMTFFNISGSTFTNLLEDIIPIVIDNGYEIDLFDERKPIPQGAKTIDENSFSHIPWPEKHERAGQAIVLRDYQVNMVNTFIKNPQSIINASTGAGKTLTCAALSYAVQDLGRTLVIVPSKSLVNQTKADYEILGLDVGAYFGDNKDLTKQHTIATWQSLNTLAKLKDYSLFEGIVAVIVDEVHTCKADALQNLMINVFPDVPFRWGMTGTIPQDEIAKHSLLTAIGPVVSELSAKELQDKGILSACHVKVLEMNDGNLRGDYQAELKYLTTNVNRIDKIAKEIEKIVLTGNTLILVDRIKTGEMLKERLENSVFISGSVKVAKRQEEYDEVAVVNDKIVIATFGTASTGINIPRLFNLVMIEPGKSFVRVIQSIGRGLRKAEDKDFIQIWDIASNSKFSRRHLTVRKAFYKQSSYPFSVEKI